MVPPVWESLFAGVGTAAELKARLFVCSKIPNGVKNKADIAASFVNYTTGKGIDCNEERALMVR